MLSSSVPSWIGPEAFGTSGADAWPYALALILVAGVVLADLVLWVTVLLIAGGGTMAAAAAGPAGAHWIVAILALVGCTRLVRSYPRANGFGFLSSPWAPVAVCASVTLGAALADTVSSSPTARGIAAGSFVVTLLQSLSIPLLQRLFHQPWKRCSVPEAGSAAHRHAVLARYAHLPPEIRFWARGKLALDPLFHELEKLAPTSGRLLDVGCGYGLPALWLACLHEDLNITAVDSVEKRVRVARHVLDGRARVERADVASWSDGEPAGPPFDCVLCIDVIHHMRSPEAFLRSLARRTTRDGTLLLRTSLRPADRASETWMHALERCLVRLRGQRTAGFYTQGQVESMLTASGFGRVTVVPATKSESETLFVARR